ncbi:MAG TPA: hypothetical protein VI112_14655 [Bacteroidia bacterium]|jgi:hypothetical protein
MDLFVTALSGIVFLVAFAFITAFYGDFKKHRRIRERRMRQLRLAAEQDERKSKLRIPGYFEEINNKGKQDNVTYHAGTTII